MAFGCFDCVCVNVQTLFIKRRWGGLMSVLDLERGTELMLSSDVEAFWLSDRLPCAAPGELEESLCVLELVLSSNDINLCWLCPSLSLCACSEAGCMLSHCHLFTCVSHKHTHTHVQAVKQGHPPLRM